VEHQPEQVILYHGLIELLTANVSESKTTMDHLIEREEGNSQSKEIAQITERLRDIMEKKEIIEMLFISRTLN
jgi:hypothetical protein